MEGRLASYVADQLTTYVIDYLEVRMASEKLAERGRDASDNESNQDVETA